MRREEFEERFREIVARFESGGFRLGPTPCADAGLHLLEALELVSCSRAASMIRAAGLAGADRARAVLEALVDVDVMRLANPSPEGRELGFSLGMFIEGVERELLEAHAARGEVEMAPH